MLAAVLVGVVLAAGAAPAAFAAGPTTGTISGSLWLEAGPGVAAPHPSGWVEVTRADGSFAARPVISPQATWSVDLAPGSYIVEFGTDDPAYADYALPSFYNSSATRETSTPIGLAAGQVVAGVMGIVTVGGLVELHPRFSPSPGSPEQDAAEADTALVFSHFDGASSTPVSVQPPQSTASDGAILALLPAGRYVVDALMFRPNPHDSSPDAPPMYFFGSSADFTVTRATTTDTDPFTLTTDYWDQIPIYRFWSPVYRGHFYTADEAEKDSVIANLSSLWSYEGIAYWGFDEERPGTIPLHRFWSGEYHGHFYTADEVEAQTVIDTLPDLWNYEGVAYYVYPADSQYLDTKPVFRFWSPLVHHHFYTSSTTERDSVIANLSSMWSYEGTAFSVPVH